MIAIIDYLIEWLETVKRFTENLPTTIRGIQKRLGFRPYTDADWKAYQAWRRRVLPWTEEEKEVNGKMMTLRRYGPLQSMVKPLSEGEYP